MRIYSNNLEDLQELRDSSTGDERKEVQKRIDDIFYKNPVKKEKKKRKRRITNPDDLWW
jgi:hypothetical protein